MTHRIILRLLFLLCLPAILFACNASRSLHALDPSNMPVLLGRFQADSLDILARRDLGSIALRTGDTSLAGPHLRAAFAAMPDDPQSRFFYGMLLEAQGYGNDAIPVYQAYTRSPLSSPYRRLMHGRYELLRRARAHAAILARKDSVEQGILLNVRNDAVAVFPFAFLEGPARYKSLGKALSTMMVNDLAQVHSLTVLERHNMQFLLDELELGASGLVDPRTAPRLDQMLGAGHIVGGSYSVSDKTLHLELTLLKPQASDQDFADASPIDRRLMAFQKTMVFQLTDAMDLELSPAEIDAIQFIPTQDLQAILAFGRGLDAEDAGNFSGAMDHFMEALQIAPTFSAAGESMQTNEALELAGGDFSSVLNPQPVDAITVSRLQNQIGLNLGTLITPGEDAREPAPEAVNSSDSGYLDTPPTPPIGGN